MEIHMLRFTACRVSLKRGAELGLREDHTRVPYTDEGSGQIHHYVALKSRVAFLIGGPNYI